MSVRKILGGLNSLSSQLNKGEISKIKTAAGQAVAAVQTAAPSATAAMRSILSNYDMSNISPSDFSKLIQQMSEKGVISQQDMQQLSSIRVDLENAGVNPDESVNLVQFYQQQLAKAQTAAAQSTNPAAAQPAINALMGRLNWLQKFTSLGGQGGVNAVA